MGSTHFIPHSVLYGAFCLSCQSSILCQMHVTSLILFCSCCAEAGDLVTNGCQCNPTVQQFAGIYDLTPTNLITCKPPACTLSPLVPLAHPSSAGLPFSTDKHKSSCSALVSEALMLTGQTESSASCVRHGHAHVREEWQKW